MVGRKRKAWRVKKRQTKARKKSVQAKQSALVPAKTDPVRQPRPRIRLRNALRAAGLDEWQIAWILSVKVGQLSESKFASDKKLLLEYMKEAIRHLDPASTAAANAPSPGAPLVEVVHQVARPDRETSAG